MGIHCEIKLFKPSDGAFIPGSVVSGAIKYAVDKETAFEKITLSLKGKGYVIITNKRARRRKRNGTVTHRGFEDYVDLDYVVHNNEKNIALPIGSYETPFNFQLPLEIPGSFEYNNATASYRARAKIAYYIRIKFERPGFMNFTKRFKKEFTVVSGIKPKLSTVPIRHGEQRKLFQLFSSNNNIVNINATIEASVIRPGGQVKFNYEIFNDTNLSLKSIETKLVEIYTFDCKSHAKVEMLSEIVDTDAKTGAIKSGENQKDSVVINIPSGRTSIEFSHIVARNYYVFITANLPFPHRNIVLKIPIQVGDEIKADEDVQNVISDDPPPSYWEVLGEVDKKDEKIED